MNLPLHAHELLEVIGEYLDRYGVPVDAGVSAELLDHLASAGMDRAAATVIARFSWASERGTAEQRFACRTLLETLRRARAEGGAA